MSNAISIDAALNPVQGKTRFGERPLSNRELLQRQAAICATSASKPMPTCTGCVFIGMFFDGTGNNEDIDYKEAKDARRRKHTNVVRLYHAHPDQLTVATNGYYSYYIPGVGTPFKDIGDVEGSPEEGLVVEQWHRFAQKLGAAVALNGAPRVIWGLTRVFNAISQHVMGEDVISNDEAKRLARAGADPLSLSDWKKFFGYSELQKCQKTLKSKLATRTPKVEMVTVNVFGFSRGAAEARAFVNWLFELCENQDGAYLFAGIPLRVQFLGIFDTVASVGTAGLYKFIEGRVGWADHNMQVHPGVEQCVHMVAGQEVRACFPLDSVRIDGKYPPNVIEYVYPGAHSDVGGGYWPEALGCQDWKGEPPDQQLARVPGYEMYCVARAAGVPLQGTLALGALDAMAPMVANDLKPSTATGQAFDRYFQSANIAPGPVEEMARQHMSWYFTHRVRTPDWATSPAMQLAKTKPNGKPDARYLQQTQLALIFVIAGLCEEIDHRMRGGGAKSEMLRQRYDALAEAMDGGFDGARLIGLPGALTVLFSKTVRGYAARNSMMTSYFAEDYERATAMARNAPHYLKQWRDWLRDGPQAELRNTAVQNDGLRLLEAIKANPVPRDVASFIDQLVHDSMAGFIDFGMPEFELNGYGLAKFRRIFFGNDGDKMLIDEVERSNKKNLDAAAQRRAQRAQWDLESANYQRTISR